MKHWKTLLALILMGFAIYFNWGWFWAVFIFLGLLNTLKNKTIHFVEEVSREESPILYWIMIFIWTLLAIYSILNYMYPF
ncbi:hypothetical protein [Oceanihabitans sediminis]|uniref:hypothetical protein n=1 Tax=Oceanihabitans sediminis TaxID=1812012 RepID=UPI00299D50A0|nr:hypothetical protein [Oceanihabitans sediminis]MDX1774166.1 hypothetical protein [Oceanihabitans sediminis]